MNRDNYSDEACERWGNTDAYREHEQKTNNYQKVRFGFCIQKIKSQALCQGGTCKFFEE